MVDSATIDVLLVEDNPGDARLAELLLLEIDPARFNVTHVDSLEAALDRVDRVGFDVALLDLSLPDTHGLEGVDRLQRRRPGLPIVVLSGLDDAPSAHRRD